MSYIVAIVGRPNVGKSTFFNRLVGNRVAIVDDESGVTRDRHYGSLDWNGLEFNIVDTGGYVTNSQDIFETEIRKQVLIAIEEADVLMFMTDITTGVTGEDEAFVSVLRLSKKPVLVVANKCDNFNQEYLASEFYSLGMKEIFPVSSMTGSGTGDLLDRTVELLKEKPEPKHADIDPEVPKICIIGKPNVGKSTLTNALLGEDRNIVADIPGTTRDSIYSLYNKFNKTFYLIDTAGIRRKKSVHEDLEFYSVMRAIRALEDSDVCFVMIDAQEGLSSQDLNIIGLALTRKKGIIVLVNKWDLFEKETNTALRYTEELKQKTAPFTDYPVIFISATEKKRISQALDKALEVAENRKQKISTSKLNEWLEETLKKHGVPSSGGREVKIKYVTQLPTPTPVFAFFCNMPTEVKESYKRFLENELRKFHNFEGVPLRLIFKKK